MNKNLLKEVLQETWRDVVEFWKIAVPVSIAFIVLTIPPAAILTAFVTGHYLLGLAGSFVTWVLWTACSIVAKYRDRVQKD